MKTCIAFALALFAAPVSQDDPQDWPRFRGPDGAGLSDARLPVLFDEEDYNWRVELPGPGHSSPVVQGDRIYLTCVTGEETRGLVCLSREDGSVLWSHEEGFQPARIHKLNSAAASTPAVDSERVVVAWRSGQLREVKAFDHQGELLWEQVLSPLMAFHGGTSSPVIVDGVVLLAHDNEGGETRSFLTGLDAGTGEMLWMHPRETTGKRAAYVTPAVRRLDDGSAEVIFASTAHGLTALDAKSGELRWEVPELFNARCVGSPLVIEGPTDLEDVIFATAGTGGGGKDSAGVGFNEEGKAEMIYSVRRGLPYVPTPVAYQGRLYLWADGGTLACVDAQDGTELWRERVDGMYYGSPICAGGNLYAMSTDGELVVVAAADTFHLRARVDLGEATQATPAVAGGVMYLRTDTHLISVGG